MRGHPLPRAEGKGTHPAVLPSPCASWRGVGGEGWKRWKTNFGEPINPFACIGREGWSVGGRLLDEQRLIERAKQGDQDAYEELVRQYQNIAFRTAYLITRSAAEAEDATQDAFIKAYYALDRFHVGAPFRPWLLRIAANEARNRRTAAYRRPTLALSAVEDRPSGDSAQSPEAAALAADQQRSLLGAIERLRDEDQLVIAARYFLDLSEAEMADVLDCPRGTVKSRLSRAIARLRETMTPEAESVERLEGGING
jgi:RNA polymerase sigma factor (sigma-70 family)